MTYSEKQMENFRYRLRNGLVHFPSRPCPVLRHTHEQLLKLLEGRERARAYIEKIQPYPLWPETEPEPVGATQQVIHVHSNISPQIKKMIENHAVQITALKQIVNTKQNKRPETDHY